jgi:hypothetical protein
VNASTEHFGSWFQRQRELRGISIWFVAARTKLTPERIQRIEDGSEALQRGGHGRATARVLAGAIGADPEEGVSRLSRWVPQRGNRGRNGRTGNVLRWGRSLGILLVLGLGVWLLGTWLEGVDASGDPPRLVHRPDYLDRLLGGGGS